MKLLLIYIFIFLLSISFLIMTDVVSGLSLPTAIGILRTSFIVTTIQENILIYILLSLPFITAIAGFVKNRKKTKMQGKS